MSLPNYLANIKSSGFYRFVWDKSVIQPQQAETLRLLIGYSEKGPFNTPVYIDNIPDFITTFGNISKRLEKRGIFFHRMAIQALAAGPILALNLKPFNNTPGDFEKVDSLNFNISELYKIPAVVQKDIKDMYDTNRFWYFDADQLPEKVTGGKYVYMINTDVKSSSCTVFMRKYSPSSYKGITFRDWYSSETTDDIPTYIDGILDDKMIDYFAEIYVFRGEFTPELCGPGGALAAYFDVFENTAENTPDETALTEVPEGGYDNEFGYTIVIKKDYTDIYGVKADALATLATDSRSNFISKYQGSVLPYFKDANGSYISLDILFNADSYQHKMMMKLDESVLDTTGDVTTVLKCVKTDDDVVKPIYIKGYEYKSIQPSDTGINLQNKILNVLNTEKGIRTALTNRVDIEYHYIVDTFDSYVEGGDDDTGMTGCKSKLSLLAKEKDNAFAILNAPAMSDFVKSSKFKDETGNFDIEKIADSANGFSLASEVNGASWCAYYTQLTFSDGSLKSYVPSAALVSNKFMEKYEGRQPYYVVAGPNYGVITYDGLVGPDYNYGRSDLDVLEPMGINAIIYVPRKGTFINSNQTAKQTPVSGLSKIHIRELVIYLQNEIEYMLQNYQWEMNTPTLRDTIASKANYILENVKNNGGIYAYNVVCDETNNTPEVIDNEMVVLNVDIEPGRACGKLAQILCIHKTGGISSQS